MPAAAATRVRKIALSPASTSGGWGSQAAADRARSTRSPQRPTSDYWPGVTKPVVRGRVELPTFRFSGVADAQLRGRCGSVDGCRRVPLVGAGCRRCRHRCRQLAEHPAASRSSAGLQPGSHGGPARQEPQARRVWPSGAHDWPLMTDSGSPVGHATGTDANRPTGSAQRCCTRHVGHCGQNPGRNAPCDLPQAILLCSLHRRLLCHALLLVMMIDQTQNDVAAKRDEEQQTETRQSRAQPVDQDHLSSTNIRSVESCGHPLPGHTSVELLKCCSAMRNRRQR
jgi:hypothetical protein